MGQRCGAHRPQPLGPSSLALLPAGCVALGSHPPRKAGLGTDGYPAAPQGEPAHRSSRAAPRAPSGEAACSNKDPAEPKQININQPLKKKQEQKQHIHPHDPSNAPSPRPTGLSQCSPLCGLGAPSSPTSPRLSLGAEEPGEKIHLTLRSHCPVREGAPRSRSQQRTGLAGAGPSSHGWGEGLTTNPQATKGVVTPPPKTEPKENVFRQANTSLEKRPPPCEGFRSEGVKQGWRRRRDEDSWI